jgi:WD40 repeat protein/energy-coupling factor transporter ATP-binding protein EcfA2
MIGQPAHITEETQRPDGDINIDIALGNPFPGLRPFSIDECHLFFGREGQVDDILLKLSRHRFVCVMGYSGSGKSSLMSCGLAPVLYGGFVTDTSPHWNVILCRPGSSPIKNLTDSICNLLIQKGLIEEDDRKIHEAVVTSVLRSGPHALVEIARFIQTEYQENIFFLIDQFEELFRYRESEENKIASDESQLYVNLLLNAVQQTTVPVYVALTMRSDFIGQCSVFPSLTDLINRSNYLVPQMSREQKKMVIEGPIAVAGGKISQRLVKKLLNDVGTEQDQLPILQHALMRTWDYWLANREPGEPMDIRHYNAVGKVSQALSQHANEAFEELSTREKEIAEILFKSVTEKSVDNRGMRRPCQLSLIAELADASETEVISVVEHFRKPGRSFLMPAYTVALSGESQVELSHESLMRIWIRLDTWVEEEFESATMYKRISEAAELYQIGKTGLWRPPDLQLALNWQKKQRPTRTWAQRYDEAFERAVVFLDTSRITYEAELKNQEMLQKRTLRRARLFAVILGIFALIASLFFVFGYIQTIELENRRQAAVEALRVAELRTTEANFQRNKAEKLQKEAEEKQKQIEVAYQRLEKALRETDIERKKAEVALLQAKLSEEKALEATDNEKLQREIAEFKTEEASVNLKTANRLYYLAKAQALATKAVQEDDYTLAGLQAMQGYHFHRRYEGKKYDPYIYSGLYSSLTKISGSTYNSIKIPGSAAYNKVRSLAVSSKDNTYYAAAADGRIFSGDFQKQSIQPTAFDNPYPNRIIALSKDENYLVNGTDSAEVKVFNLRSADRKPLLINKFSGITNDIEFLPDNSGFIIAKGDKNVYFVNHLTGQVSTLASLSFELKNIDINAQGTLVAGVTWGGQLVMIDLKRKEARIVFENTESRFLSVKFHPKEKLIAIGTEEKRDNRGLVRLFNYETEKLDERVFTGHKAGIFDVEFSPDGELLASAGADKRVQMWVLGAEEADNLPVEMENNNGYIWDIVFAQGSDYLIAGCNQTEIRVWPTDPTLLAQKICPQLRRNMTPEEWKKYVGADIPFETTCVNLLISDY